MMLFAAFRRFSSTPDIFRFFNHRFSFPLSAGLRYGDLSRDELYFS